MIIIIIMMSKHLIVFFRFQLLSFGVKKMAHYQIVLIKSMEHLPSQICNVLIAVFMFVKADLKMMSLNRKLRLLLEVRFFIEYEFTW